jgi:hypothetical protein
MHAAINRIRSLPVPVELEIVCREKFMDIGLFQYGKIPVWWDRFAVFFWLLCM